MGRGDTSTTFVKSLGVIDGPTRRRYFRDLKEVLAFCMDHDAVRPFRAFVGRWILRGAPVDPACFYAPDTSLRIVIRQVTSALGPESMGYRAFDARLWLTEPEARLFDPAAGKVVGAPRLGKHKFFKSFAPSFIPWNLTLHQGREDPYYEFNRVGLQQELVDELPDDTPWIPKEVRCAEG